MTVQIHYYQLYLYDILDITVFDIIIQVSLFIYHYFRYHILDITI